MTGFRSALIAAAAFSAVILGAACSDDTTCETCVLPTGGGGEGGGGGGNTGEGGTDEAKSYCNCMLLACHDAYHATFGDESDEELARENCLREASLIPVAGMNVEEGNFVECRIHFCSLGGNDESVCPNTVGGICSE